MQQLTLTWKIGQHTSPDASPDTWIAATVPGAVQLDWAAMQSLPPYWQGNEWRRYDGLEDQYWSYRTEFQAPATGHCYLHLQGVDYAYTVWVNDTPVWQQEGMFTPALIQLDPHLVPGHNSLRITLEPAPKVQHVPRDRSEAAQSTKPAVSYVWDFHPRLIPLGIWDEVRLITGVEALLSAVECTYTLSADLRMADLHLHLAGQHWQGAQYRWTLKDADQRVVQEGQGACPEAASLDLGLTVADPILWWPYTHGTPYRYTLECQLADETGRILDRHIRKIGFRQVRMVMNPGTWIEPIRFPKSRSVAPITLEINGRQIFAKGSNMVSPEIFPGTITAERYEALLDRALEANFELLRMWGGAIINKEAFFDLCDEKGLMVWQEFPLSCNNYFETEAYLSLLEQEATAIIKRLRHHPCVVLWCGGNELFNNWSGMTDQSLALRLLNSLAYRLDPQRPFIMTSPLMGMGHGHYKFWDPENGGEVFQWMPQSANTAYTEFGIPAPPDAETLRKIIPAEELWPPRPGTAWEDHHAFGAWQGDTWLGIETLKRYFGEAEDLETLVAQGQWLQIAGYQCIFEESRRQKPYCSMALNWCFNEPWPCAANNSLIAWPDTPKEAFYAVGRSCRPVLASARIPKFRWEAGETFTCDLFLLNDRYETIAAGQMQVSLYQNGEVLPLLQWDHPDGTENTNISGPTARAIIPMHWQAGPIRLRLSVTDHPEWDSYYDLLLDAAAVAENEWAQARMLNM